MIRWKLSGGRGRMFSERAVMHPKERAARRVLSRFGSFVRTSARSLLRKRKKTSEPGQAPSSHEGGLRRLLFFAYDDQRQSVVAGPMLYRSGIAGLLEEGGQVDRDGEPATYEPRPYMGPSFQKNLPEVPGLWRDSIK